MLSGGDNWWSLYYSTLTTSESFRWCFVLTQLLLIHKQLNKISQLTKHFLVYSFLTNIKNVSLTKETSRSWAKQAWIVISLKCFFIIINHWLIVDCFTKQDRLPYCPVDYCQSYPSLPWSLLSQELTC